MPKKKKRLSTKKRTNRKTKPRKKKIISKKPKEKVIGKVIHYFPHVMAAVVKLKTELALGENIRIKGHTTDFSQAVTSMQIDHVPIQKGKKGQEIGLLVDSRVRRRDTVYKA
jgi:hypothetical protein